MGSYRRSRARIRTPLARSGVTVRHPRFSVVFVARFTFAAAALAAIFALVLFQWAESRSDQKAREAVTVMLCIQRDAFQTRLDGIDAGAGAQDTENLRRVLVEGLAQMQDAQRELGTSCP